jgi:hypothetical protein
VSALPSVSGPQAEELSAPDDPGTAVVVLGLVAAPGAPADVAGWLGGELTRELADRHPEVSWDVRTVVDGLVQPPARGGGCASRSRCSTWRPPPPC